MCTKEKRLHFNTQNSTNMRAAIKDRIYFNCLKVSFSVCVCVCVCVCCPRHCGSEVRHENKEKRTKLEVKGTACTSSEMILQRPVWPLLQVRGLVAMGLGRNGIVK